MITTSTGSRRRAAGQNRARTPRPTPPRPRTGAKAATNKPAQKLSYSPTDEDITPDVMEFIEAINHYKRENNRPFPTWSEVLKVIRQLGYKRP